jgi:hypothetical protein
MQTKRDWSLGRNHFLTGCRSFSAWTLAKSRGEFRMEASKNWEAYGGWKQNWETLHTFMCTYMCKCIYICIYIYVFIRIQKTQPVALGMIFSGNGNASIAVRFWDRVLTAPCPAACKTLALRSLANWVAIYNRWQAVGEWKPGQAPRFFNEPWPGDCCVARS